MASTPTKADAWGDQAASYSENAFRLTKMHAADMILLLERDIRNAKTILEVGCGTGAFGKAYIEHFPKGIPGQSLICSDLSSGMLEEAKEELACSDTDFATTITCQELDGTTLEGIDRDSIDLVVSMFGVFLIPNQSQALAAVQRVLKPHGMFANGSWTTPDSLFTTLKQEGLGNSLQTVFLQTCASVPTKDAGEEQDASLASIAKWGDRDAIQAVLLNDYEKIRIHRAIHSNVWNVESLWQAMYSNPMSKISESGQEATAKARTVFDELVQPTRDGPVTVLSTASNLTIAQKR